MTNFGDGWDSGNGTYSGWGNGGYGNQGVGGTYSGYGNQSFGGNVGGGGYPDYGNQGFGGGYGIGGYGQNFGAYGNSGYGGYGSQTYWGPGNGNWGYGNQNFGGGYGGWGHGYYGNQGNGGSGPQGYGGWGAGNGGGSYGAPRVSEIDYFVFLTPQQHAQAAQQHAGMAQQHAQAAQQHSQAAQQGGHGQQGQMSDSQIEQSISNALDNTPSISNTDIQAKVNNGVVTLNGTVRSKGAKQTADNIAWNCPGVQDVQDNITVQSRAQKSQTKSSGGSTSSQPKTAATAGAGS